MQIVMLGPFAFKPKGTVSARAFPMAQALVKRGHQVTILMAPYDQPQDAGQCWERAGVRLENLPVVRSDVKAPIATPAALALRASRLRPGLVHVFKPIGFSGLAGQYLSAVSRYRIVVDSDDWEGRGGWADVNPYPLVYRRFFCWQEQWLLRRADAVTVASRTLQTQVWGLGVDPGRVFHLPNGPEPSLRGYSGPGEARRSEIRERLGIGDAPMALYLGHIPIGTDLDLAIDAFVLLHARLPNAKLVIAGSGDGLDGLRRHAEATGAAGLVSFPGWVEQESAADYVASANVVVNPYRDTLINRAKCAGKVVLAMALGKAVVTSRLGENLEYIDDGRSGLLTEAGSVRELAAALEAVLSDQALAEALGNRARERIWATYDWDAQVTEVERAYLAALDRTGEQEHAARPMAS
ncbi:MAG TPA: glycosyltransferase family 4 protein [Anaerolineae bacterium]|nr:glycosyltransferase family 4 protein [Anaerolineae bacterium]HNS51449.1 glycosyltransferase family 4 protein [Anaerolineae bacterium]